MRTLILSNPARLPPLLLASWALAIFPTYAQDTHQAQQMVAEAAALCRTESASIATASAAIGSNGRFQRVGDYEHMNTLAGRAPNAPAAGVAGAHQSWRATYGDGVVLLGVRQASGNFGQVFDFYLTGFDHAQVRAALREVFGTPLRENAERSDGLRTDAYRVGDNGAALFTFDPQNARSPQIVCVLNPPPPDAALIAPERVFTVLLDEVWAVCGTQVENVTQAGEMVSMQPGRYRRAPEDLARRYGDDAELRRERESAGVTVVERALWGRLIGGPATVVEITHERQNGANRLVAYFNVTTNEAAALVAALVERFGSSEAMAVDRPGLGAQIGIYGRRSPENPGSRELIYVRTSDRHQLVCTLFEGGSR